MEKNQGIENASFNSGEKRKYDNCLSIDRDQCYSNTGEKENGKVSLNSERQNEMFKYRYDILRRLYTE